MKLAWTKQAVRDLVEDRAYVELDNPKAAAELARRIVKATEKLLRNPELGRRGRLQGTRELIIPKTPYLIAYRINGKRIELLRVLHSSRQYPPRG